MTRQRDVVLAALEQTDGFTGAQQLHAALRTAGTRIGLTTVYRHLQALADAGMVDVLRTGDGECVYRRCASDDHHHHLVCRECGHTVEVRGPTVERWAAAVADQHGFRDVQHTVEVFGVCARCAKAAPRRRV